MKSMTVWTDAHNKEVVRLYNHKDGYAIKEIAYRLNKKFQMKRGSGAVGQQLGKLRAVKYVGLKLEKRSPFAAGKCSNVAAKAMAKIDKSLVGSLSKPVVVRRSVVARKTNGGRDPLLASNERVLEVALGDKGSIRVEIKGPILLNEALVGNIATAITGALRI
jgi:hypothetical protein